MSVKRAFPDDWSKLSEEHIYDNIAYLLRNYKKYKIKFINKNALLLDDNIRIYRADVEMGGVLYNLYTINKKTYDRNDADASNGFLLSQLFKECEFEAKPFKERAAFWWKDAKFILLYGSVVTMAALSFIWLASSIHEKRDIEKQVKKYEKTLPYYKEYQETQKQIQQYRDSLSGTHNIYKE